MRRSISYFTDLIEETRRDFHATGEGRKETVQQNIYRELTKASGYIQSNRIGQADIISGTRPNPVGRQGLHHPEQRAAFLRERLLERGGATADISDPWKPNVHPKHHIPALIPPSLEEATPSVLGVGNTSPGSDGIIVDLLKIAWPISGLHVRFLYTRCIS